jgi:hypothetical protein
MAIFTAAPITLNSVSTVAVVGSKRRAPVTRSEIKIVLRYVGEGNVPRDIKRRRRQVYDLMRRMGTPVLVKHMFNAEDVEKGVARPSAAYQSIYGQTRKEDPLSFGVGFVSVEESPNEWYEPNSGQIIKASGKPGPEYVRAPKYRGFGQGYLIYIIEPDVAIDVFKLNEAGALVKTQEASAQAPWFPEINDNDLLINITVDRGNYIRSTQERYQAKQTSPISMRGLDREGRREYTEEGGNRFVVNQTFTMALLPSNHVLYKVETDR